MTNRLSFKVKNPKKVMRVIDMLWAIIGNNMHLISGDSATIVMEGNSIELTGLTEHGVDFIKSQFTIK